MTVGLVLTLTPLWTSRMANIWTSRMANIWTSRMANIAAIDPHWHKVMATWSPHTKHLNADTSHTLTTTDAPCHSMMLFRHLLSIQANGAKEKATMFA